MFVFIGTDKHEVGSSGRMAYDCGIWKCHRIDRGRGGRHGTGTRFCTILLHRLCPVWKTNPIPWFCIRQWAEFLLFAGLLVAVSIIFSIMAYFYTYVDPDQLDKLFPDDDDNVDGSKSKKNETVYMTDMPKKTKM